MQKHKDEQYEEEKTVTGFVSRTIEQIKSMVDSDVVVGKEIYHEDGKIVLPVSKVSVGFVSGGGEYGKENNKIAPYAGGSGAGFSVIPMGLVVVDNGKVDYVKISQAEPLMKLIDILPETINAILKKVNKKDNKDDKN